MNRLFVHFQVTHHYIHDLLNHAFYVYRQAVVNPDIAARNKVKKQLKKSEAKKRKLHLCVQDIMQRNIKAHH